MFDFHGDDVSFKEKEIINQKLNDKNNPPSLEDLLVLEGIASEFKSKNKKLIEFCTKEKLKQMLDYIIKEPKVDDYNKAHKFPFICSKIFDLDIYDMVKYFFMTKNELIEDKNKINLNLDLREYDSSEIELRNQYEEDFFGNVINEFNMDDNGNENENNYNNNNEEEKKEEQKENNEDEINYKDNNDNMNNNNDNINEQKNDDKIENYNINENKKEDEDDLVNHIDEEVNQKNEKNEDNIENKKDKNEKIEENKENNNDKIQENQDNLINYETNKNKDETKEDTKEEKLNEEKEDQKNADNNNSNNNNKEIKDVYLYYFI